MSSDPIEVLRELRADIANEREFGHNAADRERAKQLRLIDAAIASLSAPQPPAEAQPVAWQFQDREGKWHGFIDERHRQNTIADGSWPIRALYAAPPSAPVGVDELAQEIRRVDGEHSLGASALAEALVPYLARTTIAQQPAACAGCEGKPAPENSPCAVCGQQPTTSHTCRNCLGIDPDSCMFNQQPAAVDEEAVDWHVAEGQCIASVQIARDGTPIVICYGRDHPTGRYVLAAQQGGT